MFEITKKLIHSCKLVSKRCRLKHQGIEKFWMINYGTLLQEICQGESKNNRWYERNYGEDGKETKSLEVKLQKFYDL